MNMFLRARTSWTAVAFFAATLPSSASAISLVQVVGVFNLFVGLFVAATFFVFVTGVFVYFSRLGTWPTHRDTAIEVMEWGVVMLFVLIIILGLVQFIERHTGIALSILAFVAVVAALFFLLRYAAGGKKKEEKKPAAPARGAARK